MVGKLVSFVVSLVKKAMIFFCFLLTPLFATVLITWAIYMLTQDTVFDAVWMMPSLLCLGTFIGGVICREMIEREPEKQDGLILFFLGMLAQAGFAYITLYDLQAGAVYSEFLPEALDGGLLPYVYALPLIGLAGMIWSNKFTFRHDI